MIPTCLLTDMSGTNLMDSCSCFKYWNPKNNKKKKGLMEVSIKTQIIVHGVFFCWISPIYFEMIKIEHRA